MRVIAGAFDYFVDDHGSYVRRRFVPSQSTQLREKILNSAMYPIVPAVADARHGSAILSLVYLALAYRPIGRLIVAEAIRKLHIPPTPVDLGSHLLNVVKGMPSAIAISIRLLVASLHDKVAPARLFYSQQQLTISTRVSFGTNSATKIAG